MPNRRITPRQYGRLAWAALIALVLIVLTGAAVRLTGSGLGCPTWPRCYGHVYPPVQTHALIEFGNRVVSGLVGVITVIVAVLVFWRRPFRRDLAVLAWLLPLGVLGQAVLGGFTVREHLAPGFVMGHFLLSQGILIAAVALVWCSTHESDALSRGHDRVLAWSTRGLVALGGLTIAVGTIATAAGPHSGGATGQHIARLTFRGTDTLQWMVNQHATIGALFGVAVIAVWWLHRRRGATAEQLELLTLLGVLIAAQGLVGAVQYELKLPAEMVWVHVALATATWVVLLWATAAEGQLTPAGVSNSHSHRTHARRRSTDGATLPADSLSGPVDEP